MSPIEHAAFAKVNLDLRVLGRRDDGYHDLRTVFQTISMCDVLRLRPLAPEEPFSLDSGDARIPSDQRNLIWRAADGLWRALDRVGPPRGARIEVVKAIPAAGGLGGGSANAAIALVMLARSWDAVLRPDDWLSLARSLGADVPFFLQGGTAVAAGIGDRLEPCPDLPELEVVLALPPFGVSTADAYRWYDESPSPGAATVAGTGLAVDGPPDVRFEGCANDLEPAVFLRHPLLDTIKARMRAGGARLSLMSGSGSTVFGLFDSADRADLAARELEAAGVAAIRAQTVSRARYCREALGNGAGLVSLPVGSAIV